MAPPLRLGPNADVAELTQWLTEWSLLYSFSHDRLIHGVLRPANGCFVADDLKAIFGWKLGNQWRAAASVAVDTYDQNNPGEIARRTSNAVAAADDAQALVCLRGLPQMKTSWVAAAGSAVLMCLDPERWTVMDVNANTAVMGLRTVIGGQSGNPASLLYDLAVQLQHYAPVPNAKGDYPAVAKDWPAYMDICRTIARLTLLSMRTVDRALQPARNWL